MNNFYIYIYLDPKKPGQYCYNDICFLYEPFYIGKGKNNRIENITGRSYDFIDIINKIKESVLEPIKFKLYENLNEEQSLGIEKQVILKIGRIDLETGPLINETSGGQGSSGRIISEETKNKMSINNIGMKGQHHSEKTKKINF